MMSRANDDRRGAGVNAIVRVRSTGAVAAIGSGVAQVDAALRAGIGGFRETYWRDSDGPTVMALVPDEVLDERLLRLGRLFATQWQTRLVALAAEALEEAANVPPPLVVMLGLPEPRQIDELPTGPMMWAGLERATGLEIDQARSQTFPLGRASMFAACAAGAALCRNDPSARVLCGAVDSYAHSKRVATEQSLRRSLARDTPSAGRALGEAAGFVLLQAAERRERQGVEVLGVATISDPGGARFGDEPELGAGFSEALERLRPDLPDRRPFATVWAGMNGEPHDAKQWSVACLRHRDLFDAHTRLQHPADRIGDAGAGLGAALFVVAHARLARARRAGASLLWATSDHGECGCAAMRNEADVGA